MNTICQDVREKKILVSDGAWGSLLMAKGLQPGECPERWNVDRPDDVRDVAQQYVDAGADIVMTNTFGGTSLTLERHGLAGRADELNETGARLSREAAGDRAHVLASMGPSGKMLLMGETTEEELYEVFKRQARAVERGGADACIIETMSAVDEASIAVRAAKENTNIEVGCSFTYDTPTADGWRTNWGVTSAQAVAAALDAGADFIGANCSVGSDDMINVVKALRAAAPDTVILVHPNAGQPIQQDDGSVTYPETPEMMAANVPKLIEAGANIIGGCCGTTPAHIQAIRAAVQGVIG